MAKFQFDPKKFDEIIHHLLKAFSGVKALQLGTLEEDFHSEKGPLAILEQAGYEAYVQAMPADILYVFYRLKNRPVSQLSPRMKKEQLEQYIASFSKEERQHG